MKKSHKFNKILYKLKSKQIFKTKKIKAINNKMKLKLTNYNKNITLFHYKQRKEKFKKAFINSTNLLIIIML